ncbi:hydrolase [Williamsia sp. Leaf354]|jgi:N-carbamoylputrescine amidase|uniref:nitrilase-related carbon-nitrogen hydrolase n=1 Tax=Williamsia sp. Leaf354 TaxID=1736349 RepID=UPI0006FF6040|nr:nitrilase-related carbon-nitrogen hydrolase [Williamsia sp. Leaf354]KQR96302.1 hydrolase [Williamsia sp. Leaf354]
MRTIVAPAVPAPPCRYEAPTRDPLRVALVQHRWHTDPDDLRAELADGIAAAAHEGARAVFLPELTLRRYPAFERAGTDPGADAEDLNTGPTATFAAEMARAHDLFVHASLYQRAPADPSGVTDGLGLNTAILVSPRGEIVAHTHKLHIPISSGYYEDTYFRAGPADDPYPVHRPEGLDAAIGLPTCWDEWFAEVTRSYSLAGAEILVYPTAIGSEPDFPDFDTQPLWQQVIVGNAIANATFMVVPNRHGDEGAITFYGSSFICDPFGRILVAAPRDESVTLVADLELDQRRDWLALFPFLATRRPDTYGSLTAPVTP